MSTFYSLLAVLCWGTSDFTGGYASKRSDAFLVTLLAHASGAALMLAAALLMHAPFPDHRTELWAIAGGALGGVGLAIFYRTLASGKMGLTAPISALIGAGIPTLFGIITAGIPGPLPIAGFMLAALGIWLISRPEGPLGRPEGISMAVLAGIGFAGFFLCISRVGRSSVLWSSAHSRLGALALVGLIVLFRPGRHRVHSSDALLALFAGCLDVTGTALFIRADQLGRLDSAVVITSLYPAVTVLLARAILKEHFHRWRAVGILAAILAVPLIALQ